MISFQAKYIAPSVLLKKYNDGRYQNTKAALVELEPNCKSDLHALNQVSQQWAPANNDYISDIYEDYLLLSKGTIRKPKFLALTTQQNNFQKLNPIKIQCVIEMQRINKDTNYLYYIQRRNVYPHTYKYIKVGETMINHLKSLSQTQNIKTFATKNTKPFYERNGFVKISNDNSEMMWYNPKNKPNKPNKPFILRIFG